MLDFSKLLPVQIKVSLLTDTAQMPKYATDGDAGADLFCDEPNSLDLYPQDVFGLKTGIAIEIPKGYVGLVHPRSGMALRRGLTVANAPGTIDSGYRGEVKVLLVNIGREVQTIHPGDRIAQLVLQRVETAVFLSASELEDSSRGAGGFGSTGN